MNHLTPLRLLLLQTLQDRIVNNPTFDLELRTQKKELLFHGNNSNIDSDQDYSFLDGVLGVDFFGAYLSYFNIAKKKVRENTRENRSLMEGLYPKGGFHCLVRILLKKPSAGPVGIECFIYQPKTRLPYGNKTIASFKDTLNPKNFPRIRSNTSAFIPAYPLHSHK